MDQSNQSCSTKRSLRRNAGDGQGRDQSEVKLHTRVPSDGVASPSWATTTLTSLHNSNDTEHAGAIGMQRLAAEQDGLQYSHNILVVKSASGCIVTIYR